MRIDCQDYLSVDTTLVLAEKNLLRIRRNPSVYGDIHFRLWNPYTETYVANTALEIAGNKTLSDAHGNVSITIPLELQQQEYLIKSSIPLANDTIYLPCGEDDVILIR